MSPRPRDGFAPAPLPPRLAGILLFALTSAVLLWLITLVAWLRVSRSETTVDALDEQERLALVEELLRQSPGVYQWSWYAPEIGYTLRPASELSAWGSTFRSNEQGYRTAPLEKADDVYRIVFLGDSWTYGMGVEREQSYPEVAARLANERGVARSMGKERVEAWTLALPGYNTFNSVSAFWHHFHELRPDAVVVGISANDNHSTHSVLPNGSSTKAAPVGDQFGDRHPVIYGARRIDSFRYSERWRIAFGLLRDLERRLDPLGIPVVDLFVGRTRALDMHARVDEAGLEAPYAVVPLELTRGRWSNRRWGHGTPEANEIYGAYAYELLAHDLGWPPLEQTPRDYRRWMRPVEPASTGETGEVTWRRAYQQAARASSAELFASEYQPSQDARLQVLGDFAARVGLLGRAATILVRRSDERADRVRVELQALEEAPGLYPLELTVSLPSPADPRGERGLSTTIEAGFSGSLDLAIPADLENTVLDVQLRASRVGGSRRTGQIGSVVVERISIVGPQPPAD